MIGLQVSSEFQPREYDVFGGLDVDKKHIDVTFMDHGNEMKSMKLPYNADNLLSYVRRHYVGKKVAFAYEAGPTGYGLHDQITAAGFPCMVVAPSMVPTAPGQRVKTNRLDSKKISIALRGGELKSIHVPSMPYRQLRHLISLRDTFVRQAIGFKARIRSMFLFESIPFPETCANWSRRVFLELENVPLSPPLRFKLNHFVSSLLFAQEQVLQSTREIRRLCQTDPELIHNVELLMSVPGVGWAVASHLLARIGDWRHIQSGRQISGFMGVVPRESSTGETVRRGSITRIGDGRLRRKMMQAAWVASKRDPELNEFYLRIFRRNPRPIAALKAVTAVANKLCKRIACVLKEQRPYAVRQTSVSVSTTTTEETAVPQGATRLTAEPSRSFVA